ncbi:hypothetical protein FOZ62_026218, partial [Perkinsus olseni]
MASIRSAICRSTPKQKTPRRVGTSAPWWNRNLEAKRKELKIAEQKLKNARRGLPTGLGSCSQSLDLLIDNTKAHKRAYFNAIKNAKLVYYRETACSLTSQDIGRRTKARAPKKEDYDVKEILDYYIGTQTERHATPAIRCPNLLDDLGGALSETEIKRVVKKISQKKGKAPGYDQVTYEHLVAGISSPVWGKQLEALVNSILEWGHFPSCLKRCDLFLLSKGRGIGPRAFRPVSLTSVLSKYVEMLLKDRLEKACGQAPPGVFGFTAGRSTSTALVEVARELSGSGKEDLAIATFDVQSAFDKISHRHIINSIGRKAGRAWQHIIESFLTGHTIHLDGEQRVRTRGISQGGSLSPVLFAISTWDLDNNLTVDNGDYQIHPLIYADDVLAIIRALTGRGLLRGLKAATEIVGRAADRADLATDPTKHNVCCPSEYHRNMLQEAAAIEPGNGHHLAVKDSLKWLGARISNSWENHAVEAIAKSLATIGQCRKLGGSSWGPAVPELILFWKQQIVSSLLYGVEAWGESLDSAKVIKGITRLEASMAKLIYGCIRSTPNALMSKVLQSITEPVRTTGRKRCAKFWMHNPDIVTPTHWQKRLRKWGVKDPHLKRESRTKTDWQAPSRMKINIGSGSAPSTSTEDQLVVFTDGSLLKVPNQTNKTGAGLATLNQLGVASLRSIRLVGGANICQAELAGVAEAALLIEETIARNERPLREAQIWLDSRAAIQSITSDSPTPQIVRLRDTLESICASGTLTTISWVRGHCGTTGNELSDWAARKGGSGTSTDIKVVRVETPVSHTFEEIRKTMDKEIEGIWQKRGSPLAVNRLGLSLGLIQLRSIMRRTTRWSKIQRRKFVELLSYHGNVRGFKGRSKRYGNATQQCRYCGREKETIAHFFWCNSARMRRARTDNSSRNILEVGPGNEPDKIRGLRLLRKAVCERNSGLNKFLTKVVPDWIPVTGTRGIQLKPLGQEELTLRRARKARTQRFHKREASNHTDS